MRSFLLLILLGVPLASSRAAVPERMHLVRVEVTGSKRYQQPDLVLATGLKPGSMVTQEELEQAANRLSASGAFSSIQFTFKAATGVRGVEADFQVQDNQQFLPAVFENFVWFPEAELQKSVHSLVPLFTGSIPSTGNMAEDVKAALHNILSARALPDNVSYTLSSDLTGAASYLFKVEGAQFKVKGFHFAGASRLPLDLLAKSVENLRGQDYSDALMKTVAEKQLLLVYRDHGFLQAKIEQMKPLMENSEVTVEVSVSEGDQFKLGGCQWSGNTLMNSADLNRFILLKPGEPVNLSTLEENLASARKAFGKFGREAATIKPEPTYSDGTVSYIFQVHEGEVYRMGKFELQGFAPELSAKLAESWKLAPGATYDNTYVNQFFRSIVTKLPGQHWEWLTFEQVDSANKIVNVRLEVNKK